MAAICCHDDQPVRESIVLKLEPGHVLLEISWIFKVPKTAAHIPYVLE